MKKRALSRYPSRRSCADHLTRLRAMELTATPRGGGQPFELTPEEKSAPNDRGGEGECAADPSRLLADTLHETIRPSSGQ